LLGQDLRSRILPQLGPGAIAYVEAQPEAIESPATGSAPTTEFPRPFAQVLVVSLRNDGRPGAVTATAAVDNALRTVLSLAALDEKRNNGRSQITTRTVAGANVTTLDHPIPFAYALDSAHSRLIVGSSPGAVARYLESASNPGGGDRFREFKSKAFAEDETFFCVDLTALAKLAGRHHGRMVEILAARKDRPVADVERDLAQILGFAGLFEAGYVTSRFEPAAAAVHRRIGLLVRDWKEAVSKP
jgi:hypothetical protein